MTGLTPNMAYAINVERRSKNNEHRHHYKLYTTIYKLWHYHHLVTYFSFLYFSLFQFDLHTFTLQITLMLTKKKNEKQFVCGEVITLK